MNVEKFYRKIRFQLFMNFNLTIKKSRLGIFFILYSNLISLSDTSTLKYFIFQLPGSYSHSSNKVIFITNQKYILISTAFNLKN